MLGSVLLQDLHAECWDEIGHHLRHAAAGSDIRRAQLALSTALGVLVAAFYLERGVVALDALPEPTPKSMAELDLPPDFDPLAFLNSDFLSTTTAHLRHRDLLDLLRAYGIYAFCSSSTLVDVTSSVVAVLERWRTTLPLGIGEGIWSVVRLITKQTFFRMFAGGETAEACFPLMDRLAAFGCSSLLNYSVEAEEAPPSASDPNAPLINPQADEIYSAIQVAGRYPEATQRTVLSREGKPDAHLLPVNVLKPTIVAIKLTGLIADPKTLKRASSALTSSAAYQRGERLPPHQLFPTSPDLTDRDLASLQALYAALRKCCGEAKRLGVRVDIDAEQSWFQPAIDRYWELLAAEYNQPTPASVETASPSSSSLGKLFVAGSGKAPASPPIVFQTYQCYRTDAEQRIAADMALARQLGFSFGAKLVRGAYYEVENALAQSRGELSPIWPTKPGTDACYDRCATVLVKAVAEDLQGATDHQTAFLAASHNVDSARRVLEQLRALRLVKNRGRGLDVLEELRGRIVFGQLLGMADNLTVALTMLFSWSTRRPSAVGEDEQPPLMPMVLKYLPYGSTDQVIPYLVRRAQENKAVLQGRGGAREERIAVGRELRRRIGLHRESHAEHNLLMA